MSIDLRTENIEHLRNKAISAVEEYLKALGVGKDKEKKKSAQISYWLMDYVKYLKNETTFKPKSLIKYKRGSIIKVNLGFKVGKEEGGLHYAVVLDNDNSTYSDIVTIVPLSSYKKSFKPSRFAILLKSGAFDQCYSKARSDLEKIRAGWQDCQNRNAEIKAALDEHSINSEMAKLQIEANKAQERVYFDALDQNNKLITELSRMKHGSVALLSQITTVSKQRIFNPTTNRDALYGVKVSNEDLDRIDKGLDNLYKYKAKSISKKVN